MHTLILGLDAYDPKIFERLSGQGKLPNLTRYAGADGYARFEVSNPPQSEVSWTSIATGLNPGAHGIFDFVHRDPGTYTPYPSLLPTKTGLAGTQFVPPHTAMTLFEQATRQGFPATVLWWPATFPARPELPVRTLPGLGAPDVLGRMGVGTFFCSQAGSISVEGKIPVLPLEAAGRARFRASLPGPSRKTRRGPQPSSLKVQLELADDNPARLIIGKTRTELLTGTWSPIIELTFPMGRFLKVHALTRAILTQVEPDVRLYLLPLQLHPLHSPWRYGTPGSFVAQVWREHGPFLTLGMPQDTTALEEGYINDQQFLDLCDSILETRRRILMGELERFPEGVLASVFDSLDRVQHVFCRRRPDVIEAWYAKLDQLVGQVAQRTTELGMEGIRTIVISDHGITRFEYKVHLNRWLAERGYLQQKAHSTSNDLTAVDWTRTQAYAVGLNSLYLNQAGREGQGCVPADECQSLIQRLQHDLRDWQGPDGRPVVGKAWSREEAFVGPLASYGPDIVVGFAPGYRASAETGLGKWKQTAIEPNPDVWNSDHCVDYREVPGVLFSSRDLRAYAHPSYRDIPQLTIGMEPAHRDAAPPPTLGDEDREMVEERLRGLGYL